MTSIEIIAAVLLMPTEEASPVRVSDERKLDAWEVRAIEEPADCNLIVLGAYLDAVLVCHRRDNIIFEFRNKETRFDVCGATHSGSPLMQGMLRQRLLELGHFGFSLLWRRLFPLNITE